MNEKLSRIKQQYVGAKCAFKEKKKTSTIDLIKDMSDNWEAYETKGFGKKISSRGGFA